MFGFTITKKADLEAMSTKLANAQAQTQAQVKKTRTAVIAGSTTTTAAAAAIAVHFLFGNGRKLNRDKIKNFDSVVEERDRVIGENNSLKTALAGEQSLKALAIGDADNLANSINSRDPEYMAKARDDHKRFRKEIYGDATTDSLRTSIELFDHYIAELHKADQEQQTQNQDEEDPAAEKKAAEEAKIAAEKKAAEEAKIAAEKKAEAIKNAEAVRNTAYQKAEEAKAVFETAETALKAADPNNIPEDIKKAYDDAKATLDAAADKLKKAEEDLKALQNK